MSEPRKKSKGSWKSYSTTLRLDEFVMYGILPWFVAIAMNIPEDERHQWYLTYFVARIADSHLHASKLGGSMTWDKVSDNHAAITNICRSTTRKLNFSDNNLILLCRAASIFRHRSNQPRTKTTPELNVSDPQGKKKRGRPCVLITDKFHLPQLFCLTKFETADPDFCINLRNWLQFFYHQDMFVVKQKMADGFPTCDLGVFYCPPPLNNTPRYRDVRYLKGWLAAEAYDAESHPPQLSLSERSCVEVSFKVGKFFKTDMCGPITLINHREQAEASFALPSWHAEDWTKDEGKAPRVQLVDIIEERQTLDANTELTVFYGDDYFSS